jgi:hypothetical protein
LPLWAAQARADGAAAGLSKPPPPQITETSGLMLGASLPTGAGFVGVRADYLFQVPRTFFHFGIFAGVGAFLCVEGGGCHASAVFGALSSWGHRHRVFWEVATGTYGAVGVRLQYELVASRALWGIASQLGYEYWKPSTGFFARVGAGVALDLEPAIIPLSRRISPAITLVHFGYKLW